MRSIFSLLAFWAVAAAIAAPTPEWIWHDNQGRAPGDNEVRYFRRVFDVRESPLSAVLSATGDNHVQVWLNGALVAASDAWEHPDTTNVTKLIQPGANCLAVLGRNDSSAAGVLVKLDLAFGNNTKQAIVTDSAWVSAAVKSDGWEKPGYAATGWSKAISLGKHGVSPWGEVLTAGAGRVRRGARAGQATPAEDLTTLDGFKVELLHSATPDEGSWICMAVDEKGRLLISPHSQQPPLQRPPFLRVTLDKSGQIASIEKLQLPVWSAMGMLFAFDSLYVNSQGTNGFGIYRLQDTTGNGQFDRVQFLKGFKGDYGEHGPHGLALGPDNLIYVVNGNFVKVVDGVATNAPHRNYADDILLPRMEDGNGFGAGQKPPGGHIERFDAEGKNWELFAAGQRNDYDIAFNPEGELFGYDSDMEWDWGAPWYRPIRVNHIVSGADFGYREGTAKWPSYYADSLPATVDTGIGSPTGVKFGTQSHFPARYQKALYILDWSYGRIFAVHLKPQGAGYAATFEPFVSGRGLPLTDIEFGRDGAMYFIVGGRGTQSGLYRVTYTGPKVTEPTPTKESQLAEAKAAEARVLRHKLEAFHGRRDPRALDFAWPHLDSEDRWIRYAARLAVESQELSQWQARALAETRPNAGLTALLALARYGGSATQNDLLGALKKFPLNQLTEEQQLAELRLIELSFIRQGRPSMEMAALFTAKLNAVYPAKSPALNRELCQLLIYLNAPDVIKKTMALFKAAPTQEEKLGYLFYLRNVKSGWTMDERRAYFSWFNRDRKHDQHDPQLVEWFARTDRKYSDGASLPKFLIKLRDEAAANLSEQDKNTLGTLLTGFEVVRPPVVTRPFVREWKMADLEPLLGKVDEGRSLERGHQALALAQCLACHRFGNEGGSVGPDITGAANRFNRHDLLENILNPSKVISDQYQNVVVIKQSEEDVVGRVIEEDDQKLVLIPNPLTGERVEIKKTDIKKREASTVSPMPEGLVNMLTQEEILDLLAYIESGGRETKPAKAPLH